VDYFGEWPATVGEVGPLSFRVVPDGLEFELP
jgi:hypothetical protein